MKNTMIVLAVMIAANTYGAVNTAKKMINRAPKAATNQYAPGYFNKPDITVSNTTVSADGKTSYFLSVSEATVQNSRLSVSSMPEGKKYIDVPTIQITPNVKIAFKIPNVNAATFDVYMILRIQQTQGTERKGTYFKLTSSSTPLAPELTFKVPENAAKNFIYSDRIYLGKLAINSAATKTITLTGTMNQDLARGLFLQVASLELQKQN